MINYSKSLIVALCVVNPVFAGKITDLIFINPINVKCSEIAFKQKELLSKPGIAHDVKKFDPLVRTCLARLEAIKEKERISDIVSVLEDKITKDYLELSRSEKKQSPSK